MSDKKFKHKWRPEGKVYHGTCEHCGIIRHLIDFGTGWAVYNYEMPGDKFDTPLRYHPLPCTGPKEGT